MLRHIATDATPLMAILGRRATGPGLLRETAGPGQLPLGLGHAVHHLDPGLDLLRGCLRQLRAAAAAPELGMDRAVRLSGSVMPGRDEPVEFLAQRGKDLASCRPAICGRSCPEWLPGLAELRRLPIPQ